MPGAVFDSFPQFALPDQGGVVLLANLTVGFGGVTAADNQGIWATDANGQLIPILNKGETWIVNGIPKLITALSIFQPSAGVGGQTRSFNTSENLIFTASFDDGTEGVFYMTMPDQLISVLALSNDPVFALTGCTFSSFGSPILNDKEDAAYVATISGANITAGMNDTGLWIDAADGSVTQVVRTGDTAPGGGVFASIGDPVLDKNRRVAFNGALAIDGASVTAANCNGIWATGSTGVLALAAQTQGAAPGTSGAVFDSFGQLVLPDQGGVVFTANLTAGVGDTTPSNNQGVWAADLNGQLQLILRAGDSLLVNGAAKTIASVSIFNASSATGGQTRSFNRAGDLVFKLLFTDGTQSVQSVVFP